MPDPEMSWATYEPIISSTLSSKRIESLLTLANQFRNGSGPKPNSPANVYLLFFENSTRTRHSFERAAKNLGFQSIFYTSAGTSSLKGESEADTVRTLTAIHGPGIFVVRHPEPYAAHALRSLIPNLPWVNAGDGRHDHPTQGLVDLLTLQDSWGSLQNKSLLILGDSQRSRVSRTLLNLLPKMGCHVSLAGPALWTKELSDAFSVPGIRDWENKINQFDAIYLLRTQTERTAGDTLVSSREIAEMWSFRGRHFDQLKEGAIILHPGPVVYGPDADHALTSHSSVRLLEQVSNGVFIRMAVLHEAYELLTKSMVSHS